MKTIKIQTSSEIPKNFTGIIEFPDGYEEWWLENQRYYPLNLNNFVVLDYYQGKYDLMWYKFLGEDKVFEYPDIPGLIIKE